jgi:hypothetical protein
VVGIKKNFQVSSCLKYLSPHLSYLELVIINRESVLKSFIQTIKCMIDQHTLMVEYVKEMRIIYDGVDVYNMLVNVHKFNINKIVFLHI